MNLNAPKQQDKTQQSTETEKEEATMEKEAPDNSSSTQAPKAITGDSGGSDKRTNEEAAAPMKEADPATTNFQ